MLIYVNCESRGRRDQLQRPYFTACSRWFHPLTLVGLQKAKGKIDDNIYIYLLQQWVYGLLRDWGVIQIGVRVTRLEAVRPGRNMILPVPTGCWGWSRFSKAVGITKVIIDLVAIL